MRVVPGHRARLERATAGALGLGIGETYDVELTPDAAGEMRLELRGGLRWPVPGPLIRVVPVRVLPPAAARQR